MTLPSNWTALSVPQQLITLMNIEREDRGETPFYAQSANDSQDALAVANGASNAPHAWFTMNGNPFYGVFYSLYDPQTSWHGFTTRDLVFGADFRDWDPGAHIGVGVGAQAVGVTFNGANGIPATDVAWLWNDEVGSFHSGSQEDPTPPFPWTVPGDPPTGLKASVSNNVLYVTWDAASVDHLYGYSGTIRHYIAGSYVGTDGFTNRVTSGSPGTSTSWSVAPCSEFQIALHAMNSVGPGPAETTSMQTGGCPPLQGTTTAVTVPADQPTTRQLGVSGGIGYGYTYALIPDVYTPSGTTLSAVGVLTTDIPMNNAAPIKTTLSYRVTDHNGTSAVTPVTLTINPGSLYWRTPSNLPAGQSGRGYASVGLKVGRGWSSSACPGCGGDKFTVVRGALPPGMWLTPLGAFHGKQQVIFGGTPRVAGSYGFLVRATDQHGHMTNQWFYIRVAS